MMSFIRPLLRKPAWTVPAGAVFAAAWVIRAARIGGCGWPGRGRDGRPGVGFGGWSGEHVGALAGSRADERQKQLSLQRGPWPLTSPRWPPSPG